MNDRENNPGPGRPKDEALAMRRCEEILRHAIRHFARDGFTGADLDAIAADIGCAKGTLYRYFPSKAELFEHSVDLVMRELVELTTSCASDDEVERIIFAVRQFLAYFDAHPEYIELIIQERAVFRDRQKPTYFKYREEVTERRRPFIQRVIDQGYFRQMPVQRVIDVIGDLLYGTIFVNYFAGRRKPLQQQAEDVLDVVLNGLLNHNRPT